MRKPRRSLNFCASTLTESTRALGGPRRAHSTILATLASSPSRRASTEPSGEFLTQPATPSSSASSAMNALKNTPWTRPETFSLTETVAVSYTFTRTTSPRGIGRSTDKLEVPYCVEVGAEESEVGRTCKPCWSGRMTPAGNRSQAQAIKLFRTPFQEDAASAIGGAEASRTLEGWTLMEG